MPTRETFWNIPHWAEIGQYILGLLTLLVFAFGVVRRARRWRMGKPERRADRIGARLRAVLVQAIGQYRTAQDIYAGIMHMTIFWGMAALLMGTILATVDWDVTHLFLGFQFLTDGVYVLYELILDIVGLLLLLGLGMAALRRYVLRPPSLQGRLTREMQLDDAYVIAMLVLVAITGYLVEGLRIAVLQPDWAPWSPVGNALATVFTSMGDPTNRALHLGLWIAHGLVAFTFIASIPFTKLFHIVASPLNIFFGSLEPAGALSPARATSRVGVRVWRDFTWKQLLDFDTCLRCGRCQDACPVYASGMNFSPRDLMIRLKTHVWERGNGRALHGDVVKADELWACTTCRACVQVCPVLVDHLSWIVDMRRYLVGEGQMDGRLQDALANLARYGNSFGQSERMRARWMQPAEVRIRDARTEPVEYLWFVGDYASYNASLADISLKAADVFQRAGMDFGILYDGEHNAGNDARRAGEEGLFEMLRDKNAAVLNKCTYKTIVTTDPHSYNTLKHEYGPALNGGRPVLHFAEVMDQLLASGQLRLGRKLGYRVTYHDPCYLGRYNSVFDPPRRVIESTGCELIEMPRNREAALCCGAGGGRVWMEESQVRERPSEARIREAMKIEGVQAFVVACPKDLTMYQDALKTTGSEGRIVVKDLAELVHEAM